MTRRLLFAAIAATVVVLAVAAAVLDPMGSGNSPPAFQGNIRPYEANAERPAAPNFQFTDRDGRALTLADFKGRVVLVNYWATWCGPCVEEMPALDRLQARLGGPDFAVVAISVDRQGMAVVAPFFEKHGLERLPIYLEPKGDSMRALSVRGLPTTLLLDREGRIAGRLEGAAKWDSPDAEALIRHYQREGT